MNGKQHGKGVSINTKGERKEGEWVEGKKVNASPKESSTNKKGGAKPSPGAKAKATKKR